MDPKQPAACCHCGRTELRQCLGMNLHIWECMKCGGQTDDRIETDTFHASEARAITDAFANDEGVSKLLERAYGMIKEAARKGEYSIPDPTAGLRQHVPAVQRTAVYNALKLAGYKITKRQPDAPNDPGETLITW